MEARRKVRARRLSSSDLNNEGRSLSRGDNPRSGRLLRFANPTSPPTTVTIRSIAGIVIFSLAPSAVTPLPSSPSFLVVFWVRRMLVPVLCDGRHSRLWIRFCSIHIWLKRQR